MLKYSHFLGETEFGVSAIPLFGKADAAFEKCASSGLLPDVVKYINSLRPRSDAQYVLVNAMGAGEYFGSNVNGDYFTEASLIHRPDTWTGNPLLDKIAAKSWAYGYPTFYNAHPYAHHRNKNAARAFGEVELATWNARMHRVELVTRVDKEKCMKFDGQGVWDKLQMGSYPDVSMGTKVPFDTCFPAGTLVRTSAGHRPIEQLKVADVVLTHTGKERPITAVMSRTAEDLVELVVAGLPRLSATENHPFLVVRREQLRACKGTSNGQRIRHTFASDGVTCRRCGAVPDLALVWVAACELRPGDYLALPTSVGTGVQPTPPQARMLGYYLGDGYIIKQRTGKKKDGEYRDMGFGFSVGSAEIDHLHRLLGTLAECSLANEANVYDAGAGREALIVSVYDQGTAAWLQRYGGRTCEEKYLNSDVFSWSTDAKLELVAGYLDTDGSVDAASGQARITSINRGLLLDVQRLLLSVGITATVCFGGTSSGYGQESIGWYLCLSAAQTQKLLGRSVKVSARDVSWESPQSLFWGGYWLTPVKSVEELDGETEVFNISVEEDESYIAEGRAVHNCSICLNWDAYERAKQTFDPARHTHAGQAILEQHRKKPIRGVSITRADYCSHAKQDMNKIYPDGRKVFVYNDYPRFFDISFVFIGADRTAKVMLFVHRNGTTYAAKPSAEIAEELGVNEPGFDKAASVDEELLKTAFGKVAGPKYGEISKNVVPSQFAGKAVPVLTRREPSIDKSLLDLMGRMPLESSLSTAGGMGIVLRPHEFQRVVLGKLGLPSLADDLESKGLVFKKQETSDPVDLGTKHYSSALAQLLLPLLMMRSALGPIIEKRVVIVLSRPEEKSGTATSHPSELLDKIGSAYNGYRQSLMDLAVHTQNLLSSTPSVPELYKLGSAPVEEIFTPLSVSYLQTAFLDEFGVDSGVTKLGQETGLRGEGFPLKEHVANQLAT